MIEHIKLILYLFLIDSARYLVMAGVFALVFYILRPKWLSHRKTFRRRPERSQMWRELLHSMKTVFVYALMGYFVIYTHHLGLTQVYEDMSLHSAGFAILGFAVMVIGHDAYFYWTHRMMHTRFFFHRFHSVHHKSVEPTPWTAYSFNTLEAFLHAFYVVMMVHIVPLHPLTIAAFMIFQIFMNVLGHGGYEVYPRWWLDTPVLRLKNTVTHHYLHHHRPHRNFGLYFTWWDRWMGTEDQIYRRQFLRNVGAAENELTKKSLN